MRVFICRVPVVRPFDMEMKISPGRFCASPASEGESVCVREERGDITNNRTRKSQHLLAGIASKSGRREEEEAAEEEEE